MKALLACLGAVVAASVAFAQVPNPPQPNYYQPAYPARVAPDMCGPYDYSTNGYTWYPSYNVYPPFQPYNGVVPVPVCGQQQQQQQQGPPAFPYNPWMRSPRDYFMWSEAQKMQQTREIRPPFVP
jgi:hypothetical protein